MPVRHALCGRRSRALGRVLTWHCETGGQPPITGAPMASVHANRGAKRAREARAALGLDPAAPLACLLTVIEQRAGHPVVVAPMPGELAGACFRQNGGAVLWVNGSSTQSRPRQRFTLAHELGHAWCGHDGALDIDTFTTVGRTTGNPYEIQANTFAAEFLVPRAGLEDVVQGAPTLEETVTIATHYGVSPIMVVYRFKQLGLASERRIEQLEDEVGEGLHRGMTEHLGLRPLADRLGSLHHLPYLSPALEGTELAAAVRREPGVRPEVAEGVRRLLS
jgi:Zn-dependent peptidase ImmA (M78 family)